MGAQTGREGLQTRSRLEFLARCIGNFFVNITYPIVIVNQLLQGKCREGASDTGRFVMNSTLGVGGLFDPATNAGMPAARRGFWPDVRAMGDRQRAVPRDSVSWTIDVRDGMGSAAGICGKPDAIHDHDETNRYSLIALNFDPDSRGSARVRKTDQRRSLYVLQRRVSAAPRIPEQRRTGQGRISR